LTEAFVSKLRDGADAHSTYLRSVLTNATQQELRNWNPVQPLSPALRDTLIAELNQLIGGQSLYDRKRFRGVQWQEKPKEREVLMKSLVKEVEAGISQKWDWVTDLTSFNRLLLEEIYPGEIPRSLKAE
jgi:hypothetical protein